MGSFSFDQKRCQLCLYNRYDLRPAKKTFDAKLQYQNKKNVTINNYPTLFKSPCGANSLKEFQLPSLTERPHRCRINQENSVISCNICGICSKQNPLTENSGRYTITRSIRKHPSKSHRPEDLSSRSVFIAVEDWTDALKRNQFSNSASMQDNYYENLKQLDNASSNNPPYENSAMFQENQQDSVDLNRNQNEALYAVVNKNVKGMAKPQDAETMNSNLLNNNQTKLPVIGKTEINSKVWKGTKKELNQKDGFVSRSWTCKCSYAYNPASSSNCDICDSPRKLSQSLSQQMKIVTLTKNNSTENQSEPLNVNNNQSNSRLVISKSTHAFDEFPSSVRVPMASFEQDLEDDFQFLPAETSPLDELPEEWTCKKCTLKNSATNTVCIVCGGSKLRSTSCMEDMTLRKGEFWTCSCCTLKNSLSTNLCIACKATKHVPSIIKPPNFRPYTGSSPASTPTTPASSKPPEQQIIKSQLTVTPNRASRSPSPRHDKAGAIPKRHSTGSVLTRSGSSHGSHSTNSSSMPSKQVVVAPPSVVGVPPTPPKTWHCPACTFENTSASVVCEICSSTRSSYSRRTALDNIAVPSLRLEDSRLESKLMENLRQMEESEARTKWENIIQYCKDNNELFVDDSFPPAAKSLYYNPGSTATSESNPVVQWRRPQDINCDGGTFSWSVFSQITPKVSHTNHAQISPTKINTFFRTFVRAFWATVGF